MNKENKEVFGITLNSEVRNWADNFDMEQYESDSAVLVSKETYHHEEDGLVFDFKMVIQAEYCEGAIFYGLYLIPTPSSLYKGIVDDIMDFCGVSSVDEIRYDDILAYGYTILFGNEKEEDTEDVDDDILNLIASVTDFMVRMRGFYMDKAQNRIGTTGWDIIQSALDGSSPYDKAIGRLTEKD